MRSLKLSAANLVCRIYRAYIAVFNTVQERVLRVSLHRGDFRVASAYFSLRPPSDFFWRLTDGEGVSGSYEGNDRTSVPNFVSEERGSIVEIYMDDLPICVGALDPGPTVASLR